MKSRCLNPNHTRYATYGGRGVTICERWTNSFESFLADMGVRPEGTSLGRFGDEGNYEPGNVKWMTSEEQYANRRPEAGNGSLRRGKKIAFRINEFFNGGK